MLILKYHFYLPEGLNATKKIKLILLPNPTQSPVFPDLSLLLYLSLQTAGGDPSTPRLRRLGDRVEIHSSRVGVNELQFHPGFATHEPLTFFRAELKAHTHLD